jgi:hypothetical protein
MLGEEGHVSELAAPYVLGALEPDEIEQVELHLAVCATCRDLVEDERRVVGLLPYLAEPQPVPARARRMLLNRIQDEYDEPVASGSPSSRWIPALAGRVGWVAAASAAVLALVFAVNSFQMQGEVQKKDQVISEQQRSIVEFVSSPRGWMTNLETTGAAPNAGGGLIADPTRNAAILVVDGLTQPEEGSAYVVWMINDDRHVNVGELIVDNEGRGQLYITMPGSLASYDGIIITHEHAEVQVASPSGVHVMASSFD